MSTSWSLSFLKFTCVRLYALEDQVELTCLWRTAWWSRDEAMICSHPGHSSQNNRRYAWLAVTCKWNHCEAVKRLQYRKQVFETSFGSDLAASEGIHRNNAFSGCLRPTCALQKNIWCKQKRIARWVWFSYFAKAFKTFHIFISSDISIKFVN